MNFEMISEKIFTVVFFVIARLPLIMLRSLTEIKKLPYIIMVQFDVNVALSKTKVFFGCFITINEF